MTSKQTRKPAGRKPRSRPKPGAGEDPPGDQGAELFFAEAAYAQSIVRQALGDTEGCVEALRRCVVIKPDYAPGLLALGSAEFQLERKTEGLRLFRSLLDLPDGTEDLAEIVDEAGDFLIDIQAYDAGLELYRLAASRFPGQAVFLQGASCCASGVWAHDEAIAAAQAGLELEPDNQELVNDLGWSFFLAGRLEEARAELKKAVGMDPGDELARENLKVCEKEISKRSPKATRGRRGSR